MSIDKPSLSSEDKKAAALIATLHEAGQRLEELTGGEVDAVLGPDGTPFLLPHAQGELRLHEAARQAAILNALPANIALLDASGFILSVNESWRRFGCANGLKGHSADVGSNYVRVCLEAHGEHSEGATWVADGLGSVLKGTTKTFSTEYACHSPSHQRWFHMTATPLSDERLSGVVVMHSDITDRKLYERALETREAEQRESARQLTVERARMVAAQRVAKVGSWETELATMDVTWSEETYRIHELESSAAPVSHAQFLELVHPADRENVDAAFAASLQSRGPSVAGHRLLLPGGRIKFVEEHWEVVYDEAGRPSRVVGTCQDVTEARLCEVRIERLSRGYKVLSQINSLIVRVRDREELFREASRIAVETGGFPFAWIGKVDRTNARIVPITSAGASPNFLEHVGARFSLADDAPLGHGPSALAVRTGAPVIVNNLAVDPRIMNPEVHTDLGIFSLVALPIFAAGEVVAVFGLHASDVDYFDEVEIELLTELANDIGFAIDYIGNSEKINYLAFFDSLTGLANRNLFLERAAQCLSSAASCRGVMVLVDLERFKSMNDSLGMHAGDDLLKQVATWLGEHLHDPTLLARVGSDHFALMLLESDQPGDAARNLDRLIKEFHDQTFLVDGSPFRLAAKFGVASFPEDATTAYELIQKAESALKNAKAGGHRQLFYSQKMTETVAQRLKLENQLRQALENHEFVLHYQPKVSLATRRLTSVEALIRWNDPRTGLVPPGLFIPILEETGLIYEVGRWALQQSLRDYLRWRAGGLRAVRIAVNVSPLQFRHPGFIAALEQIVATDPHAAEGLELELTEGIIMGDMQQAIASLHAIRALGISIAIDDFGTGFSSLGYLSKLPIDTLKIDRMFVTNMVADPRGLSLVSTIISLAHSLQLRVVAEGVETEEQAQLLRLLRCDEMQGYLFSRPVPVDELERNYLAPPPGEALSSVSGRQAGS